MSRNSVFCERQTNEESKAVEQTNKIRTKKKEKCSTAEMALKLASWLNGKSGDNESSLSASTEYFREHIDKKCNCMDNTLVQVVIGCNYYHLFLHRLKQFSEEISAAEKDFGEDTATTNSAENGEKFSESSEASTTSPYSNKDSHKPSKYAHEFFAHLVHKRNCNKIVEPLQNAIHSWEHATKSQRAIDFDTVTKLHLVYNIISCYYAFENYGMLKYKFRSAKLLLSISYLSKQASVQLHAYYLMIQVFISNGAMNQASSFLKKADFVLSTNKFKPTQNFEASLIFLAKCEVALYSGKAKQCAKDLVDFIQSDYLQKVTLNRYYIKSLALHLASKFPAGVIKFCNNFEEFVEPMQAAVCILKRWHRSYFAMSVEQKKEVSGDVDPIWYKFALYGFAMKVYQTASLFYTNLGTPVDLAFLHNALFRIGRKYCFLSWILHLLTSSAEIDLACDKKESSINKLNAAAKTYINAANYPISCVEPMSSSASVKSPSFGDNKTDYDTENKEIEMFSPEVIFNNFKDECVHEKNIPVWKLRHILLKGTKRDAGDYDGESDDVFISTENKSKVIEDVNDDFIHINFKKHEIYFHLSASHVFTNNSVIVELEELHSKVLGTLEKSFVNEICNAVDMDVTAVEKFFPLLDSSILFLKVSERLIFEYSKNGDFDKIVGITENLIPYLNEMLIGIEMKTLISNILLKYAQAKFSIFNLQSQIVEYDVSLVNEIFNNESKCKTPSPKRTHRRKPMQPKAPKGKNEFKMDEFKEYLEELSKASVKNTKVSKVVKQASRFESVGENCVESENIAVVNDILNIDKIYSSKKPLEKRKVLRSVSRTKKVVVHESKPRSKSISEMDVGKKDSGNKNKESVEVNVTEEVSKSKLKNITCIEGIETILFYILKLFDNHPPTQLYRDIHFLMFQVSATQSLNERTAHHFSECTTASSIRYRNILLTDKKIKNTMKPSLGMEMFQFNPNVDINATLFENCLVNLPSSWRIVQLHAVSTKTSIPDIYVSRFQNGKKPIFFKIKGNSEIFLKDFMSELYEIIELSNASITNKDIKTFWKARFALDNRFKLLMKGVDEMWFGPFIGVFMGQIEDKMFLEMCSEMRKKIMLLSEKFNCKDESLLDMIIESFALLTNQQFVFAINTLFSSIDFAHKCLKECEKIFHMFYPIAERGSIFETLKTEPLGLVLNKPLASFPFENIPTAIKLKQEIFRVPSLRFLSVLLNKYKTNSIYSNGINPQSVYYLLNPSNNLPKTEQYFKEKFLKQTEWSGTIGCAPNSMELKNSLESKDFYIFFGHGAGTFYYRSLPEGLEGTNIKSASLVIGCCSGKLISDGENFEPYGIPWRFIMNGSPSYLGILWDVTDRDIDRFADKLLEHYLPNWIDNNDWKPISLCNALVKSRDACKLKYLIGASPVVYGLPISACNSTVL